MSIRSAQPEHPAQWPGDLLAVFERSVTCGYASLTSKGQPVTYPVNPYLSEDRRVLEVTTGPTYPAKADRARRNSKVALLFSDVVGAKLENPLSCWCWDRQACAPPIYKLTPTAMCAPRWQSFRRPAKVVSRTSSSAWGGISRASGFR